jgi:hypothetical protein
VATKKSKKPAAQNRLIAGAVVAAKGADRAPAKTPSSTIAPPPRPTGPAVKAMPAPTATAPPPPRVPVPGDLDGDGRWDPFFRADDLAAQASFWSQWNTTFAQLDSQLADLRTQTTYDQTQQDQAHTQNQSSIQDDAAARGISHSSIKDASVAQETTDYTRAHQLSTDKLDNQDKYVAGVKNDFETTTKPQTLAAWALKKAENASASQTDWDTAHPPADPTPAAAPAGRPGAGGNPYVPNTPEWAKFAVEHAQSWKQVDGKWFRKNAAGGWTPTS